MSAPFNGVFALSFQGSGASGDDKAARMTSRSSSGTMNSCDADEVAASTTSASITGSANPPAKAPVVAARPMAAAVVNKSLMVRFPPKTPGADRACVALPDAASGAMGMRQGVGHFRQAKAAASGLRSAKFLRFRWQARLAIVRAVGSFRTWQGSGRMKAENFRGAMQPQAVSCLSNANGHDGKRREMTDPKTPARKTVRTAPAKAAPSAGRAVAKPATKKPAAPAAEAPTAKPAAAKATAVARKPAPVKASPTPAAVKSPTAPKARLAPAQAAPASAVAAPATPTEKPRLQPTGDSFKMRMLVDQVV